MPHYNAVLARNADNVVKDPLSSHTAAFSHYNNLSAQLPVDISTGRLVAGDAAAQAAQCLKNIQAILSSIDHVLNDVVRLTVHLTSAKDLDAVAGVCRAWFPVRAPSLTMAVVAALPMGARVQIDALVSNGEGTIPGAPQAGDLIKLTNATGRAPSSPLSAQTVAFSHYNNLTCQLPVDPRTGRVVEGGIRAQAVRCLNNIKAILESIDVPMDDIVKVTIYLQDLADIEQVNEVYRTFFPDSAIARAVGYLPARTVVAASGLPMGALVQMEAMVSHGDGTPPQKVEDRHGIVIRAYNTDRAPRCPHATQSVAFSHYNHLSALLPLELKTGRLTAGGAGEQAALCLAYMQAIVESSGHALEDVVKVNIFLTDMADAGAVDAAYRQYFPTGTPARRVLGVAALQQGARVQMDAVVANAEGTPPQA